MLWDDDFLSRIDDVHSFGGRVTVHLGDRSERGDILHIRFYCVFVLHVHRLSLFSTFSFCELDFVGS